MLMIVVLPPPVGPTALHNGTGTEHKKHIGSTKSTKRRLRSSFLCILCSDFVLFVFLSGSVVQSPENQTNHGLQPWLHSYAAPRLRIIPTMALTEPEFRFHLDAAFDKLNRSLGVVAEAYDVEILFQNNVLSIEVEDPNPGKIVISPQAPTRQVWISAQATSFKLDWSGSAFVLPSTGETLNQLVGRLVGEQLGVAPIPLA